MSFLTRRTNGPRPAATRLNKPKAAAASNSAFTNKPWQQWLLLAGECVAGFIILLTVVLVLRDWLQHTAIRQVQLLGTLEQSNIAELQSAVDSEVRGNFFSANIAQVQAVAERYPWVDQARVVRHWPDRLHVVIREKQPVARWDGTAFVTANGEVFRPRQAKNIDELPVLLGPRTQVKRLLNTHSEMAALLRPVGLRLQQLELTDRMSWVLTLEGGVKVLIDDRDTMAKLERFVLLYDRQLATEMDRIARIDLRYRNGVAVGWRQPQRRT